ncbi:MAG: putative sterol carrier protein, partial [Natronomonas sp.]
GDCRETATMQSVDEREHRVRLTGEYEDWKRLLSGELGLLDAVMGGTLNVTADMKNTLQYMDAQLVMVDVAAETDKRFLF